MALVLAAVSKCVKNKKLTHFYICDFKVGMATNNVRVYNIF